MTHFLEIELFTREFLLAHDRLIYRLCLNGLQADAVVLFLMIIFRNLQLDHTAMFTGFTCQEFQLASIRNKVSAGDRIGNIEKFHAVSWLEYVDKEFVVFSGESILY